MHNAAIELSLSGGDEWGRLEIRTGRAIRTDHWITIGREQFS